MLKIKNGRFLKRMDWKGKEQYQNAKFIHSWHLILEQILKASNTKYLKRTDWRLEKQKYKDAKFIYKWHLTLNQNKGELTMKPRRFLTKECIKG